MSITMEMFHPVRKVSYVTHQHKDHQDLGLHCFHTILREPKLYKSNKKELYSVETRLRHRKSI